MTTHAQHLAATLRALADHLDAHPDLPPVTVHWTSYVGPEPADLQVVGSGGGLPGVLAWARSLGADTAVPESFGPDSRVCLRAAGELPGGVPVTVWDLTPALDGVTLPWGASMPLDAVVDAAADAAAERARAAVA